MVALPLLVLFVLKGSYFLFLCFVLLLSFLGLIEYYRMALPERRLEGMLASVAGSMVPIAVLYHDRYDKVWLLFSLTLLVLAFSLIILFRITEIRNAATEVSLTLLGFLYVPLLLSHLVLLRGLEYGIEWVFLLLVIVMSGDTGAYYVGSSLGKTRLYPIVSPKKSVEGSLGGLVGSIVGAVIAKYTFFPVLTLGDCLVTALVLGVLGQVGDLFESLLKRSFGVKDSGTIIPGHGGILDRLDSILFAAPAAYYYAFFVVASR